MFLKRILLAVTAWSACAFGQTYYWNRDPALSNAGGISKSYNWSATQNGIGGRPAGAGDEGFSAPALDTLTTWKFLDQDGIDSTGKLAVVNGKLILSGEGEDFSKEKHFLTGVRRADIKGNFDVTVRVDSQFAAHDWSKAGIIMANSFSDYSQGGVALVAITPKNGAIFEWNQGDLQPIGNIDHTTSQFATALPLPIWLRLAKDGTQIRAFYRTDTTLDWTAIGTPQTSLGTTAGGNSEIGLFVTAVDSAGVPRKTTAAAFDDFRAGGDISNPALDYAFNGSGANADVDVVLAGDFAAHSLDFTGYSGKLSFNSYSLSLSGSLRLIPGMQSVNPGTGTLVFTGSGQDTLWTRAGDAMPALRKTGSGKLSLVGPVLAASLRIDNGTFDLNNNGAEVNGLASTGGTLEGLGADDSLIVSGDADFSGLAALNAPLGFVTIKAMGNGGTPINFDPGGKTFPRLTLWTWATGLNDVTLIVGPGSLTASNGLSFRNHTAPSGYDGFLDFRTRNPNVTVSGGNLIQEAAATNWQMLYMGDGIWTSQGDVNISLRGNGSADKSTFRFTRTSGPAQTIYVSEGPLYAVEHDAAGAIMLSGPLAATSLRQSGGSLDFNGFNLALKGDLSVTKGGAQTLLNLGGRTVTVEGNASFAGTAAGNLGLNPSTVWTLKVSKALIADSADIANSDASLGQPGTANKGCIDQKGNKNWAFYQPPVAPGITREPTDALAKPGWKVAFSLAAQGTPTLSYEWRRQGDSIVLSTDTSLVLDTVKEGQSGTAYYAIVSNAYGKDTTRMAYLTVRACDSVFAPPADMTVKEGETVSLGAKAGCASEVSWTPISGPVPRLLDPSQDTLVFTAPRVKGDSIMVLQFSARYGATWESKEVTVRVRDTIPDPKVSLPAQATWNGLAPRVIRPVIVNAAALAAFPGYPLRYFWSIAPNVADTSIGADSLVLKDPGEDGNLEVTLCADNGGSQSCAKVIVAVERASVSLRRGALHAGPLYREGSGLRWTAPGLARIVDWRGRTLWQAFGARGAYAQPSSAADHALRARTARLEFRASLR